jgi:hypothetical protein
MALVLSATARAGELKVVGVLANTSGLSERPVPYAFYSGIASDAQGRLYLAGAAEGVVVLDTDGRCLAVLPMPAEAKGWVSGGLMLTSGKFVFFTATGGWPARSAVGRIDTSLADPTHLSVELLDAGPGYWAVSPTLDPGGRGRVVVGQSDVGRKVYRLTAFEPATSARSTLFEAALPAGATPPWMHRVQAEPDGTYSICHRGGVDWLGRFDAHGQRVGEDNSGALLLGSFRFRFGYEGSVVRTDVAGRPAPGDCGSPLAEVRLPSQLVQIGDNSYFVGRGGAYEARWNGSNYVYTRRLGAIWLEDLADDGARLVGIAYHAAGNNDVQHPLRLSKTEPAGRLLDVENPLHGQNVGAVLAGPADGFVEVYRAGQAVHVGYPHRNGYQFDLALPLARSIGQAAVLGRDMLLADPQAGTVWRRPLLDKQAAPTAWITGLPGVTGVAAAGDAVYLATPTSVQRRSANGAGTQWEVAGYQGIRRLAATPEAVYVCDTKADVVDQLDPETGARIARLGVAGEAGSRLDRLNQPYAVAADLDGVYIADNGNGRVLVATNSAWRPEIARLAPPDTSPVVAARVALKPPGPGKMSVNVYDAATDVTVRQLACAVPTASELTWDGRDMYGNWVAPGRYTYHGILTPTARLKYVTSIGQSGRPPYRTADGKGSWGGVWGYVYDIHPVDATPESDILVLWAFEEGEGGLIRMSQYGEVRWKQHLAWWMKANQVALTSDGTFVYIAAASALGAPEGQSNYGGELRRPLLWRVDAATGAVRDYPGTNQQHMRMFGSYTKEPRVVTAVAVHEGRLYLTAPADNKIYVADAESGEQVATWDLPGASGVTFDAQGRVLAGSGTKLVVLDASGRLVSTLADAGGQIWAVAALPGGGCVATVGEPRHQVVSFDAGGRETRVLGQAGGRPRCGKMIKDSFLEPTGVGVTAGGKLFVAEAQAPKRFTRWSADGKLEREFHGPYYYSGMFAVDFEQPENIYGDTHGDIIRYKVDYATGHWDVDRYWIGVYNHGGDEVPVKWAQTVRHHDGRTYLCGGSGGIVELRDDGFRNVAAIYGGWVAKTADDGNWQPDPHAKAKLKGTWSDLNGDGRKQLDEWQVTDRPAYPAQESGPQQGWGIYFDEQFNGFLHDWSDGEVGGIWELPVAEWRNGAPIYHWEEARHVALARRVPGLAHGSPGVRTCFADADGVYGFNGGYNAAGLPGVGHGHDWEFVQLTRYDPRTGLPRWHAGERAAGFAAPGQIYCPSIPAGSLGPYLYWTDENSLVHVWDKQHGLYAATLLEDGSRGIDPTPYTIWVELFNSRVFKHPKTGKTYLVAASDAIHVYEVSGLDEEPPHFDGSFTVTAEGLAVAKAKAASREIGARRQYVIHRLKQPLDLDAGLAAFAAAPEATMVLRDDARGTARLLLDDHNLYVAFDVREPSPWRNAGGDATAPFKTGDEVSLWLGPTAGKREPGVGDVRILFSPKPTGEGVLVLAYRPKVLTDRRPVTFRSPSGTLTMDRLDPLPGAKAVVRVRPDGYTLLAAVPRAALEFDLDRERFGLDFSINFADPAGQRNVARLHWARNGAANVYDLPSEARLEPELWGDGLPRD